MKIVYINDQGGVSVIHPSQEVLALHTIQEIALKDVPSSKPFKIIQDTDVPSDRSQRAAWSIPPSLLTDGVGAASSAFQEAA